MLMASLFVATLFSASSAHAQLGTTPYGETRTTTSPATTPTTKTTPPATTTSKPSMQFFNFTSNRYESNFPWNTSSEIVVSGSSISTLRPIDIIIKINGSEAWRGQILTGAQSCKDPNTCSTKGPALANPGTVPIEIVALSLSGQTIVTHTEGPPAVQKATTTQTTNQPAPVVNQTTTVPSAPAVSTPMEFSVWWPQFHTWLNWWWLSGFIFGSSWIFLWIFVGWQWTRRRFWGFGWPWPWWFWIPWVWFIPWLIIGIIWWFDWWLWWAWIWWLFPWGFWLYWWIIVYKEAKLWMWRQKP